MRRVTFIVLCCLAILVQRGHTQHSLAPPVSLGSRPVAQNPLVEVVPGPLSGEAISVEQYSVRMRHYSQEVRGVRSDFLSFNQQVSQLPPLAQGESPLGPWRAETSAERLVEELLLDDATSYIGDIPVHLRDDDSIDVGMASYLVAADLPAFRNLSPEQYNQTLNDLADRTAAIMTFGQRDQPFIYERPDPNWYVYTYASTMIGLGMDYPEVFKKFELSPGETTSMFADERNVFLPGLLETGKGSCISLPMLYLAIGQRLGLPVHLVTVGKHTFIRWEDDHIRLNIETTITNQVAVTENDEGYLKMEGLTRGELQGTDTLRNLTNREVVGILFHARSGVYAAHGPDYSREALRDAERAVHLAPENRLARLHLQWLKDTIEKDQPVIPQSKQRRVK
jgi:Transglutaminase-like superfamily